MKKSKVEITHPDKVLFPKSKITKEDLVSYYEAVAPRMIPLIKDRPVTMQRYPNGITKKGFLQKNISEFFPSWVKSAPVSRQNEKGIEMVLCNDIDTLSYIANLGCITPHIWLSKVKKPNYPDRMTFDLDPSGKQFSSVVDAAHELKEVLEGELGLKTYLMTTGSKGLHLVVPIKPVQTFDEVRDFAKHVGEFLVSQWPKKYTISPRKESRRGKLYIDYLRNGYAQMAVAPYAVRALEHAPIATPIHWKELTSRISPQQFTIKNISARLKKRCPWEGMEKSAKSLYPNKLKNRL